jgi:3D-(3,5/4)-trihydroxycyclohexane-1,2-dione acylhydrolase (decyclizing)
MTVAEALTAFLVENGIRYAFGVGGHGNTPLLEAFYPYHRDGRLRVVDVQHEAIAAHAATALKWVYGIESVVFTSIGPGWFNTLIGQNTAMSNGYGFLVLAGDKTTAYEGRNMQQLMRDGQFGFVRAAEAISKKAYCLVDPRNVYSLLREALAKTREPGSAGPVNVFLPMNLQATKHEYNLDLLLRPAPLLKCGLRPDPAQVAEAVKAILRHRRIVIRAGGGAAGAGPELKALAERIGAAIVMGPVAMDTIESGFALNVGPAGSKGSIAGNFASEDATLVINAGGRGVCQADCSGTLYANAREFININLNAIEATRYDGIPLVGDVRAAIQDLLASLAEHPEKQPCPEWMAEIADAKRRWDEYLQDYYAHPHVDGKLTQPAVIRAVDEYVNAHGGLKIYDAGDVQAHGFQIARHPGPKTFISDTGNSAMGFGISAAFALGLVGNGQYPTAIIGDGSFLLQAQAIRDMVKHGSRCTVVVLDNQAMGAITSLQWAQNYHAFATFDPPSLAPVDFAAMAESMGCPGFRCGPDLDALADCLARAREVAGPAVVDVKVAFGRDHYVALDAFGRWNVGPWSEEVEAIWEGKK